MQDGALDYHEFVNFMLKLRTREGFSVAQGLRAKRLGVLDLEAEVKQFKEVFDRFDDNNNSEAVRFTSFYISLQCLKSILQPIYFNMIWIEYEKV